MYNSNNAIKSIQVLFSLSFLLAIMTASANASCGAASCPLNSFHPLRSGWLSLSLSHEYINQDQLYLGSSLSFVGAIPEHHDEIQTINERNEFLAGYGISDNFALNISVPLIHRQHTHIGHENNTSAIERWDFTGLGDIVVNGQYTILNSEEEFTPYLSLSAGVKLATGVTDFRNTDGEFAEVTIQPGSGSTDLLFGLNYRQTLLSLPTLSGSYSAFPLNISILYQVNNRGTDRYRFGNVLHVHLGTAYQFISRSSLLFQINSKFQDYADVGNTDEPRDNTGGTWIFASPGLLFQIIDDVSMSGYIQFPIYENVHGLQQTAKFNLQLGLTFSTNLLEKN